MRSIATLTIAALVLALVACSGGDSSSGDAPASEEAPSTAPSSSSTGVPAEIFTASAPEGVVPLIAAKTEAKAGDRIVFEAVVGGRAMPFVENRAVFFVTDPSIPDCDKLHPGKCKQPWDYCCEPKDNLLKHMATVQIVDANGKPLHASVAGAHGLDPLDKIVVTGTVAQKDEGVFVVNAEQVHIREG